MASSATTEPGSPPQLPSDEALARLRAGYDRERFHAIVRGTLVTPFPPAAPWADYIMGDLYAGEGPSALSARERELILIAMLVAAGERGPLAAHVYWGLMEGLAVSDVLKAATLGATYSGAHRYVAGMQVITGTLRRLDALGQEDETAKLSSVVPALLALF